MNEADPKSHSLRSNLDSFTYWGQHIHNNLLVYLEIIALPECCQVLCRHEEHYTASLVSMPVVTVDCMNALLLCEDQHFCRISSTLHVGSY